MTWWASVNKDKTQENQLSEPWSWEAVYAEGTSCMGSWPGYQHKSFLMQEQTWEYTQTCLLFFENLLAKTHGEEGGGGEKKKRGRRMRRKKRRRNQLTRGTLFSVKTNLGLKPITYTCVISIINNVGLPPHFAGENLSFLCKLFLSIFHEIWKKSHEKITLPK